MGFSKVLIHVEKINLASRMLQLYRVLATRIGGEQLPQQCQVGLDCWEMLLGFIDYGSDTLLFLAVFGQVSFDCCPLFYGKDSSERAAFFPNFPRLVDDETCVSSESMGL
jgi:hypothetical protein